MYAIGAVATLLVGSAATAAAVAGMALIEARSSHGGLARPRRGIPGRHRSVSRVSSRHPGGARWATRKDLVDLRTAGGGAGRLVLGRAGRTVVATEARHSVLVLGPTQSGKTSSLAIPALLQWRGVVIATSVKRDLVDVTAGVRATRGRVWVFDPTGTAGSGPSSRWSPLAEATTWSGSQRVASWMVEATPTRAGLSDGAFWYQAATKLLAPLLRAAVAGSRGMADVVRWVDTLDFDEPEDLLADAGEQEAAIALFASAGRDERIRSSISTTLETVLAPYEDPIVAASAEHPDIDPWALLHGPNSLYLCGPAHEQFRVQGVFSALVSSVVNSAIERAEQDGAIDPPLLVVLDEVANIAPLRDLDTLASTAAGLGIQLLTVCQDLAQLTARYGPERARTIANNHRAKVVLSGIADVGTLDTLSGLAGDQAVQEETVTFDLRDGRRSTSSSTVYRRLAPADELRRVRPGEAILIYGHLPAARLRLTPWYDDAALRRAVAAAAPGARRAR
jgi:type IV secretion system protein VirD4